MTGRPRLERPDRSDTPDTDGRPTPRVSPGGRRRVGPAIVWTAVVVAIVAATIGWLVARDGTDAGAADAGAPTATAPVERRDLVETASFGGALAYADSRQVIFLQASASVAGTADEGGAPTSASAAHAIVTWLPAEGATLTRGQELFTVNRTSTRLLYGELPAFRTLLLGVADGPDVEQLERNLRALGFDESEEMTIDGHFDLATKAAVERWQRSQGTEQTGIVRLGTIVFFPGARRVAALQVAVGDPIQPGQTVMTTTATVQKVTVALEPADRDLVAKGDLVSVQLPDGGAVAGTIESIGTVATSSSGETESAEAASEDASTTISVEMTVALDQPVLNGFDQAPVEVDITRASATDVLVVPVTALVALAGGGYAVEVVDTASASHLARVEPGLYAGGYVEVTGEGIEAGTRVVVPA